MRRAEIYYKDKLAGILTETDDGDYIFTYDRLYAELHGRDFINFTMPVREESYIGNRLHPFFEGLIPEGWLLDIASRNWKINPSDRMGLLMACCGDCIGAVSVKPIPGDDES
jgi:serine/threonine-protein kinase HipA